MKIITAINKCKKKKQAEHNISQLGFLFFNKMRGRQGKLVSLAEDPNLLRHITESRHWISPQTARESPSTVLHCWQWRVIGWLLSASEGSFLAPALWIKTLPSNSMLEVLRTPDPDGFPARPAGRFPISVASESKGVSSSVKFGAVGR